MRNLVPFIIVLTLLAIARPSQSQEQHADNPVAHDGRPTQMLKTFPLSPDAFKPRMAGLIEKGILDRFGAEEWAALILTNEFHQHIGVYSILGAKMGVRARERLSAPLRAVRVVAETGEQPPWSCAVDGLQMALGSTLGQGLIRVPAQPHPRIAAAFEHEGRTLRLALKPEFQNQLSRRFEAIIKRHGNLTPAYFCAVADFSYEVWTEFDRRTIFEEGPKSVAENSDRH